MSYKCSIKTYKHITNGCLRLILHYKEILHSYWFLAICLHTRTQHWRCHHLSHMVCNHLENTDGYARVLFDDFSLAFDTVHPHLLTQKLTNLNISTCLVKWFYSLVTNRSQQVKVNNSFSEGNSCSTGVPQGAVSSPILFMLYTNECRSRMSNNKILKYSDDTIIVSLLRVWDHVSTYLKETDSF